MARHLLLALGLVAGCARPQLAPQAAPSPTPDSASLTRLRDAVSAARDRGDIEGEARALEALVAVLPDDPDTLAALAGMEMALLAFDPAIVHMRHYLTIAPDSPIVRQQLATALLRVGKFDESERELKRLLPTASEPEPFVLIAWLHSMRGEREAARAEFAEVLRRWPQQPRALIGLAALERQAGNHAVSRRLLEEAIAADGTQAQAFYELALTYRSLGLGAESQRAHQRFQELSAERSRRRPPSAGMGGGIP